MPDFHETTTLLAALDGDVATVAERVAEMLPGERRALAAACDLISAIARDHIAVPEVDRA